MVQGDENSILMNFFLDDAKDLQNFKFHGHEVDMSCAVESGGYMFIIGNRKFETLNFFVYQKHLTFLFNSCFSKIFDFFVQFVFYKNI